MGYFNGYGAKNDTLKWCFEKVLLTFCYMVPLKCDEK